MDPPAGGGYNPVEPPGGTAVRPLKDLQDQVEALYVQGRIDADLNQQIVGLFEQLVPLLRTAGLLL
jgi:hypothetical protein